MEQIGKYKVLGELGRGGFGAVYLCEDNLKQKVAVKVFDPKDDVVAGAATSATSDASAVLKERFQSEAITLRQLSSNPYIVDLYDFDETEDGVAYYVMPYLEHSLVNEIGKDAFSAGALEDLEPELRPRRIPIAQATRVLTEILEGMKTVHREGLVHRDLKPANILFDKAGPEGKVQVCDFGIAKLPDAEHSQSGVGMGSRNYMSPEQRESAKHVEASSDIYAIGVMAYRMLTGTLPGGRFDDPIVFAPTIGQSLNDLILASISYDVSERPKDAGEFLKQLKTAITGMDEAAPDDEGTSTWVEQGESSIRDELKPLRDQIKKLLLEHGEIPNTETGKLHALAAIVDLKYEGIETLIENVSEELSIQIKPIKNFLKLIDRQLGDNTVDTEALYVAGVAVGWDRHKVDEVMAERRSRLNSPGPDTSRTAAPSQGRGSKTAGILSLRSVAFTLILILLAGSGWWFYNQQQQETERQRVAAEEQVRVRGEKEKQRLAEATATKTSNQIASAQQLLTQLGYTIARSGQKSARLTAVIRQFEQDQKMPAVGEVDETLLQALVSELDSRDEADWARARSGNSAIIKAYIVNRPTGKHIETANKALAVSLDNEAFKRAQQKGGIADLLAYRSTHPQGRHLGELDNLTWKLATREESIALLREYINAFPTGAHVAEAGKKLGSLKSRYKVLSEKTINVAADQFIQGEQVVIDFPLFRNGSVVPTMTKLDAQDNLESTRRLPINPNVTPKNVFPTSDGGWVLKGEERVNYQAVGWVYGLFRDGSVRWTRRFEKILAMQNLKVDASEAGRVLIGVQAEGFPWVEVLDASGRTQWKKTFAEHPRNQLSGVRALPDGGALVSVTYFDQGKPANTVYRIDSKGQRVWSHGSSNPIYQFAVGKNGALFLTGSRESDIPVIKLDRTGRKLWEVVVGSERGESAWGIKQANDGSLWVFGSQYNSSDGVFRYLAKINPDGKLIKDHIITEVAEMGAHVWPLLLPNGELLYASQYPSGHRENIVNKWTYWLRRYNSQGEMLWEDKGLGYVKDMHLLDDGNVRLIGYRHPDGKTAKPWMSQLEPFQ